MDPVARRWRRTTVVVVGALFVFVPALAWGLLPPVAALVVVGVALAACVWVAAPGLGLPRPRRPEDMTTRLMQTTALFAATPSLKFAKGVNLSDVAFSLVVLALLLRRPGRRGPRPAITSLVIVAALLAAGGLIGTIFGPSSDPFPPGGYHGSAFGPIPLVYGDLARFLIVAFGMLVVVYLWRPDRGQRRSLAAGFATGAVASVLYSFTQSSGSGNRAQGLTTHPVFYGTICAVGVLVGVGLAATATGWRRLFGLGVAGLCGYGVLQSGTRGALLMVVAGVAFYLVGMRSARIVAAFAGLALVGLFTIAVAPNLFSGTETVVRLQSGGGAVVSNQGRDEIRQVSYSLIKKHGLTGVGFRYLNPPHSFVLGTIVAAGMLGLIGGLVLAATLVTRFLANAGKDPMTLAAISGLLGLVASSWVVNFGWDRWLWVLIAGFATVRGDPEPVDVSADAQMHIERAPAFAGSFLDWHPGGGLTRGVSEPPGR